MAPCKCPSWKTQIKMSNATATNFQNVNICPLGDSKVQRCVASILPHNKILIQSLSFPFRGLQ